MKIKLSKIRLLLIICLGVIFSQFQRSYAQNQSQTDQLTVTARLTKILSINNATKANVEFGTVLTGAGRPAVILDPLRLPVNSGGNSNLGETANIGIIQIDGTSNEPVLLEIGGRRALDQQAGTTTTPNYNGIVGMRSQRTVSAGTLSSDSIFFVVRAAARQGAHARGTQSTDSVNTGVSSKGAAYCNSQVMVGNPSLAGDFNQYNDVTRPEGSGFGGQYLISTDFNGTATHAEKVTLYLGGMLSPTYAAANSVINAANAAGVNTSAAATTAAQGAVTGLTNTTGRYSGTLEIRMSYNL